MALFVFDGPNKPPFKRNAEVGTWQEHSSELLTKKLLDLFGFPHVNAPGEAEAECALLQKEGIVDAVLSEDVDTMMFGCTLQLRNWSMEGPRSNKRPTHVNVYQAEETKARSGLDSEAMILIALMSGGDYLPIGIPKCGIKVACEAARAGFGHDLCQLSKDDTAGLDEWRGRLQHELHTNESGFFRTKHKSLMVPSIFPDSTVLGYYTHPTVSTPGQLDYIRAQINWKTSIDVLQLRIFVAETFNWRRLPGAKKFIRGLAPALLIRRLHMHNINGSFDGLEEQLRCESMLVHTICDRRMHESAGKTPELLVAYTPVNTVELDLTLEESGQTEESVSESDSGQSDAKDGRKSRPRSPCKRVKSKYDPTQVHKIWIPESVVKLGVPLMSETWEDDMGHLKKYSTKKISARKATSKLNGGMKYGSLDPYVKVSKSYINRESIRKLKSIVKVAEGSQVDPSATDVPNTRSDPQDSNIRLPITTNKGQGSEFTVLGLDNSGPSRKSARRPSHNVNVELPLGTNVPALGILGPGARCFPARNEYSKPPSKADLERNGTAFGNPIDCHVQLTVDLLTPTKRDSTITKKYPTPHNPKLDRCRKSKSSSELESSTRFSQNPQSPTSERGSLPSPSQLSSPPSPQVSPTVGLSCKESTTGRALDVKSDVVRAVAPRESLPGAWRILDRWTAQPKNTKLVYREVEVVDLSAS
ncbi:MAG: hypothetical protein LQ342_007402 [Letrouitia transgressa]|nr:MAG: hypothetical protein LQ342_007402 [Letrouitia transgressa]